MRFSQSVLCLAVFIAALSASSGAYTTSIRAPAVLLNEDAGVLTTITLNVTYGNGTVAVTGPAIVNVSTLQSAQTAAAYAAHFMGLNESRYNFIYRIDNATNVSGPSGGLALTLLAVSALGHRQLAANFTTTGTISPGGEVGEIGGIYDKAQVAAAGGMRFILVPYAPNSTFEYMLYYISQQQFGIPLIPVANVSDALGYAYGERTALPRLDYNISINYRAAALPNASISCAGCNESAFAKLVNFTFNTTGSEIGSMGSQYQGLKSQMRSMLAQYGQIAQKGYLYSGADLAFLEYTNAFTIANSNNITKTSTAGIVNSTGAYCSSLLAPQMTDRNYEYVAGGELRQAWGETYAKYASAALNASGTSDGLILSVSDISKSEGWCLAAGEMYYIAAGLGGTPVQTSASFNANVLSAVNHAMSTGLNFYSESAQSEYRQHNYAAALYASYYADSFSGQAPTKAENASLAANLSSYDYGIWPTEFALQSQFYTDEAGMASNQSQGSSYAAAARMTAYLASLLNSANRQITGSFEYNVTPQQATGVPSTASLASLADGLSALKGEVAGLQNSVSELYWLMLFVLVLLFAILISMLVLVLRQGRRRPRR